MTHTPNKAVFKMLWPDVKNPLWKDIPESWEGFGLCWEAAQKKEWWGDFIDWTWSVKQYTDHDYVNPTRFMEALYEFSITMEDKWK